MLKKFLRDVIIIVVGKQAEDIAELLNSKKHVNEFIIAKKLDITINQTRNILYKLSDHGLVSSIRKKDKRKGWYTYFWKIEIIKALEFLKGLMNKKIEQVSHQIKNRESKDYYVCERCVIEVNEENAMAYNFTCNECGDVFTIKDKTKDLRMFRKELAKLEKEVELIDVEMDREKAVAEKKRLREIEKIKKLKAEARKKTREINAKKKAAKKKVKKKAKKKVKKKATKKKTVHRKGVHQGGARTSTRPRKSSEKILLGTKKIVKKKIAKKKGK